MGVSHSFSMNILNHLNYIKSINIYFLRALKPIWFDRDNNWQWGLDRRTFARPGANGDPHWATTAAAFRLEDAHVRGPEAFARVRACRRQNRIGDVRLAHGASARSGCALDIAESERSKPAAILDEDRYRVRLRTQNRLEPGVRCELQP